MQKRQSPQRSNKTRKMHASCPWQQKGDRKSFGVCHQWISNDDDENEDKLHGLG